MYSYPACLDSLPEASACGVLSYLRPASRVANAYCYLWTSDPTKCAAVRDDDKKQP